MFLVKIRTLYILPFLSYQTFNFANVHCSITMGFWITRFLFSKSLRKLFLYMSVIISEISTAQKMEFSIKDFFSKCNQIRSFLRIWSHLLKKSLMKNFILCAVKFDQLASCLDQRRYAWNNNTRKGISIITFFILSVFTRVLIEIETDCGIMLFIRNDITSKISKEKVPTDVLG